MDALSLYELNILVRKTLTQAFPDEYWVQAELSDVRITANGHCYLEFIQKDAQKNTFIAKARGVIWANVFRLIKPYFESTTGQSFVSGIKVLVKVRVEFHELYGYSLTVSDIDPTYTIGDMARRRIEILRQLEKEGILNLNKELETPELPQRIAVISSATAAGYHDFKHQLETNSKGYYFYTELFPAIMQGDQVEASICEALQKIISRINEFDVVVIIRGGGSTSDLSGFDRYTLAAACAQFPLPIITGIGHERDDTVLDSVAHIRVKTPTAAAGFLINKIDQAATRLNNLVSRLAIAVNNRLSQENFKLLNKRTSLFRGVDNILLHNHHKLKLLSQLVKDASPQKILSKGYSLTLKNGKMVTDASQVNKGDEIVTRLANSSITSIITQ
ncbi:exodeoxyribonuclease VII large subunit [Bacteroides sp. 519]|uniref:exodeoxyribonuclease VII large subunit n=1 Tax=Bacteroides sp. 519 TaxID=2302937 RepID=UPI0013D2D9FD|nr:exodeoxyribonuclease VII large subunit [Bacteroides sp. 519]NDV58704.1 exodeoxyribonuclease VII large subunit [Bacteroides sp. 519]